MKQLGAFLLLACVAIVLYRTYNTKRAIEIRISGSDVVSNILENKIKKYLADTYQQTKEITTQIDKSKRFEGIVLGSNRLTIILEYANSEYGIQTLLYNKDVILSMSSVEQPSEKINQLGIREFLIGYDTIMVVSNITVAKPSFQKIIEAYDGKNQNTKLLIGLYKPLSFGTSIKFKEFIEKEAKLTGFSDFNFNSNKEYIVDDTQEMLSKISQNNQFIGYVSSTELYRHDNNFKQLNIFHYDPRNQSKLKRGLYLYYNSNHVSINEIDTYEEFIKKVLKVQL